jgi:signal transduction histidine kinase
MKTFHFKSFFSDTHLFLPAVLILTFTILVGAVLFLRSQQLMAAEIRQELRTAASLGALQLDAKDVVAIRSARDSTHPSYAKLVKQLSAIRKNIPNARFVYIFRKTEHPLSLAFVADADGLSTDTELDGNNNGNVDPNEEPGMPGELYDITGLPELQGPAFEAPTVGKIYEDQWGKLLSGFAPITDANGKTVAVLGIDMRAEQYYTVSQSVFSPIALLGVLAIGALLSGTVGLTSWKRRVELYRRLDAERSGLVGLAMHQIGAPLASLRWWKDLLLEEEKEALSAERKEAYDQMAESIERMSTLIDSLRRATSVHSGGMSYERLPSSLRDVIEDAVEQMSRLTAKKRQHVAVRLESDVHLSLDRKLITGVIAELIENASWYSPESTEIHIRAQARKHDILVEVQDHGCGIAEKDRDTVFHEFTRGSNANKYKPVGNGLGLYVAKGIIDMAGGHMWLQSTEGKGTTVSFTLPLAA